MWAWSAACSGRLTSCVATDAHHANEAFHHHTFDTYFCSLCACRGGAVGQLQPGWAPPGQRQWRYHWAIRGPGHAARGGGGGCGGGVWGMLLLTPWIVQFASRAEALCVSMHQGLAAKTPLCLAHCLLADAQAHVQGTHKLGAGGGVEPRCGHRGIRQAPPPPCSPYCRLGWQTACCMFDTTGCGIYWMASAESCALMRFGHWAAGDHSGGIWLWDPATGKPLGQCRVRAAPGV